MPLSYDQSTEVENERTALRAGRFPFKVESAEEKMFKTGNEGLTVKLLVSIDGRDVPAFANLVYSPKALWKLREFLDCVGLDFDDPPELFEIENKTGVAQFGVTKEGYFEVKKFLDPIEQTKESNRSSAKTSYTPPPQVDDDVPF